MTRGRVAALLVMGYGLLMLAWLFANPPFESADEAAHYLRTLGVAQGLWVGTPAKYHGPGVTPTQLAWIDLASRAVPVPAHLAPDGYGCNLGQPDKDAACQYLARPNPKPTTEVTPNGTYEPLPYLLPALFVRLGSDGAGAVLWARLGALLPNLALIGWAIVLLSRSSSPTGGLLGICLALSPMVIQSSSMLQPSGLEACSAVLYAAALLRVVRDRDPAASTYLAAGIGGAVLALSRSLAPLWVVLIPLLVIGRLELIGPWQAWFRRRAAWLCIAAAMILIGLALNHLWESAYGPRASLHIDSFGDVAAGIVNLPGVIQQEIGVFGYLETYMPWWGYALWASTFSWLLVWAYSAGSRRERLVLAAALAANVAVPVLLISAFLGHIDFALQGRHVLPLGTTLALLAADVLAASSPQHALTRWGPVMAGLVNWIAWYANGHRESVGVAGTWFYPLAPHWSPPLGWWLWVAAAAVGAGLLAVATSLQQRQGDAAARATTVATTSG